MSNVRVKVSELPVQHGSIWRQMRRYAITEETTGETRTIDIETPHISKGSIALPILGVLALTALAAGIYLAGAALGAPIIAASLAVGFLIATAVAIASTWPAHPNQTPLQRKIENAIWLRKGFSFIRQGKGFSVNHQLIFDSLRLGASVTVAVFSAKIVASSTAGILFNLATLGQFVAPALALYFVAKIAILLCKYHNLKTLGYNPNEPTTLENQGLPQAVIDKYNSQAPVAASTLDTSPAQRPQEEEEKEEEDDAPLIPTGGSAEQQSSSATLPKA